MRHDPIPTTLHIMVPDENVVEKPQAVDLDWSTRSKIVIRPRCQESISTAHTTANQRTFSRTVSVFSQKRQCTQKDSAPELEVAQVASCAEPEPTKSMEKLLKEPATNTTLMVTETRIKKKNTKTVEDSKIKKPAKNKPDVLKTMSNTSRTLNLNGIRPPAAVATPLMPPPLMPKALRKSSYADEYILCGCISRNRPPCKRCQLMLLADRFCELIDAQCEKWGVPPRD